MTSTSTAATQAGGPVPPTAARRVDVFSFWGEPLADIRAQIERVHGIAAAAGRADRPRISDVYREATGTRGSLQAANPGALAPGFDADALVGAR